MRQIQAKKELYIVVIKPVEYSQKRPKKTNNKPARKTEKMKRKRKETD
jgi:hypothetical protein